MRVCVHAWVHVSVCVLVTCVIQAHMLTHPILHTHTMVYKYEYPVSSLYYTACCLGFLFFAPTVTAFFPLLRDPFYVLRFRIFSFFTISLLNRHDACIFQSSSSRSPHWNIALNAHFVHILWFHAIWCIFVFMGQLLTKKPALFGFNCIW